MGFGDIVPWKWGGLRHWDREERPLESFRREMDSLHRNMDRMFESLLSEGPGPSMLSDVWGRGQIMPQLDLTEDDKAFLVKMDLPGMDEKDVHVTLSDRILTIRGEKKEDKETKEKDYYRRERATGTFRRSLELPADADAQNIEASFKKGVLTIQLPKTKEAQQKIKHIQVHAA